MGSLNTSLQIGIQALDANQGALTATANNIANANTPGYTEEVAEFSENQESDSGGGGVTLDGLQSIRDEVLNTQIQQQTSLQSSVNAESSSLQQAQTYFNSSGNDIASTLTSLSSSLAQLSASPTSSAAQQAVLSAGKDLAEAFNTTADGLTSVQSSADSQVTETVAQINSLTQQIAKLNGQLSQSSTATNNGGTVEDQRDELVQQLSALTGISVTQGSDGEEITTGNGTPLVMGSQSFSLQTTTGSDGFQQVLDSNGNNVTSTIQGGTLGGAIQVRDQVISGYLSQLNTLAGQFAASFNAAQKQGYSPDGAAGQDFFSLPTNTADAASGIGVSLTNASQIATSSDGSPGSNGNVANLSAALTNTLPSGQAPAQAYAGLVFQVGNDTSNAGTQSTAIGQNLLQLTNQQSSASGVNIDDETSNLIRFQTAYEAGARIVSTIQQLNSVTLNMGTSGGY